MANMLCRTKGNANPKGKPRVYFTCHPADFEKYFDKVCEDIFKTHDCAIYYTEDMSAPIADEDLATDLGSNNLFVIPVTFQLLTQPNRAMDQDFPYALAEHIPVLPIVMESGIDAVYSKPDKFGALQYLYPFSSDATEISYEEKLKKYLESVLISDETAQRIRAAFDAYIFLSYRKKDRRYANELMRLIHKNPRCRDIAIWYDEFLTPGESFRDSIDKILHDSKLFTLLVTPNLLEEPDGKPNFVMAEEYPAAKASGIDILPAEMEPTDKAALSEKFRDIPDCVDPKQEDAFHEILLTAIQKVAITTNDTDPEHNFLMGLAYLDGIDVEVDRQRGLELITAAAESDLPEAMEKLHDMYDSGIGAKLDYHKSCYWAKKLADHYCRSLGEEHPKTLGALNLLGNAYGNLGDYATAMEFKAKTYALRRKVLGEEHTDTLTSLNNLAYAHSTLGNNEKALELLQTVYTLRCKILGEEHTETLISLNNLAVTHGNLGNYETELRLKEQNYRLWCKVSGEESPKTLTALNNLAIAYSRLGDYQKALVLAKKVYTLRCKVLGEEHPATLNALVNLASAYGKLDNLTQALELKENAYALRCKISGERHPDTLRALNNLAVGYSDLGEYEKALELNKKAYALRCDILGEAHPDTLLSLNNLAYDYISMGEHSKALELLQKVYVLRCKVSGEEHAETLVSLNNLAYTYDALGDHQNALELHQKAYMLRCKVLGQSHPDTIVSLWNLMQACGNVGDYPRKLKLAQALYDLQRETLGAEHVDTLNSLYDLAVAYSEVGNTYKELEVRQQFYQQCLQVLGEDHPATAEALEQVRATDEKLAAQQRSNICPHCGGKLTGLFRKTCSVCGKRKDF